MMSAPYLEVRGLAIRAGNRPLLSPLSLSVGAGEPVILLGESGAGKSLVARAILGALPDGLVVDGEIRIDGAWSPARDGRARRRYWGRNLGYIPQDAMRGLDPLRQVARQLHDVYRRVARLPVQDAIAAGDRALAEAGLGAAGARFPFEISGGMAQRAVALMALAGGATLLIADEPTKGLDAYWRERMIAVLRAACDAGGAVLVITHDLHVARSLGGRVLVMRAGEMVDTGPLPEALDRPVHDYTRRLVEADPVGWRRDTWAARRAAPEAHVVVSAAGLGKRFGGRTLFEGLDLRLRRGERVALLGASGAGKTTLGNVLAGFVAPDAGRLERGPGLGDLAFQKIGQEPAAAFPPHVPVGTMLRDVARRHRLDWRGCLARIEALSVPAAVLEQRPQTVSGGELQRLALARALMVSPAMVFADEPTSRLDTITQRDTLRVLLDAVDRSGALLLLVTHEAAIAGALASMAVTFDPETAHCRVTSIGSASSP